MGADMKWIEYEINGVRHARPVRTWHDNILPLMGSLLVAIFIFIVIPFGACFL